MKIGELSARAGCAAETIRYYEQLGLLQKPGRSGSNYRHYGEKDAERLIFIRHCRGLDMSLDEIRTLLQFRDNASGDCAGVSRLLDGHLQHVVQRIRELQGLKAELNALRKLCGKSEASARCGILEGLSSADERPENKPLHIAGAHPRKLRGG